MTTMKAVRIHAYGGPEQLHYEDAPRPEPQPNEVLIKIHAAGVNPVDYKIREGFLKDYMPVSFPYTLGFDIAGIVETVGSEVAGCSPGDEVFAHLPSGGYAEYAVVTAEGIARKPRTLDFAHAASLPVAALTAWQALFEHGNLTSGQTVLIHAAAGGVGHLAVQMAHDKGAHVVATASAGNRDFVIGLGADTFVDYTTEQFEDYAHDIDMVLSTIPGDTQERSWAVLKPTGILVSVVDPETEQQAKAHGKRGVMMSAHDSADQMAQISALAELGKLKPTVAEVFALVEAAQAQDLVEKSHVRGKVVLSVP